MIEGLQTSETLSVVGCLVGETVGHRSAQNAGVTEFAHRTKTDFLGLEVE